MYDNAGVRGGDPPLSPAPLTRRQAPDARQYDSFVVRVWRHPGDNRLVRVDLRHVQSGASQSAIDCDAGWIGTTIGQQLREHGSKPHR